MTKRPKFVPALGEWLVPVLDPVARVEAERAERTKQNLRRIKQGFTLFRKNNPQRGVIVSVESVDIRRGLAETRAWRSSRTYTVPLCDLYPYQRLAIVR